MDRPKISVCLPASDASRVSKDGESDQWGSSDNRERWTWIAHALAIQVLKPLPADMR